MIVFASLGTAVGAVALLVVGAVETVTGVVKVVKDPLADKDLVLHFLQVADIMLLATVLYVISLGLFELFVDDTIKLPAWLEIHTLDDLKVKLIGVVVAVLAVFYLGTVLKGGNDIGVLWAGLGTGAVVLALAAFVWASNKHG